MGKCCKRYRYGLCKTPAEVGTSPNVTTLAAVANSVEDRTNYIFMFCCVCCFSTDANTAYLVGAKWTVVSTNPRPAKSL